MGYGAAAIEKTKNIIFDVGEGLTLTEACTKHGLNVGTFNEVISGVRELAVAYARTREVRADVDVDDALRIADNPDIDPQRARNMIEIRKWRASKHHARVYGDRIDLNVSQSISIGEALTEARSRILRPISDQLPTLDAEVIDMPQLGQAQPADKQSVSQEPGEPDIFS